jgi:hypothetical protein
MRLFSFLYFKVQPAKSLGQAVFNSFKDQARGYHWIPFTLDVLVCGKIESRDDWISEIRQYAFLLNIDTETAEERLLEARENSDGTNIFSFTGKGHTLRGWMKKNAMEV